MIDSKTQQDFREDQIAKHIVDASIKVHKKFGPGLLESLYEACLAKEISTRGLHVQRQTNIPVDYEGDEVIAFRLDLLIDDAVIVEVKSCEKILPIHEAQLLTYMKLTNKRLGFIINFNEILVKNGIKRMVLRNTDNQKLCALGALGGE